MPLTKKRRRKSQRYNPDTTKKQGAKAKRLTQWLSDHDEFDLIWDPTETNVDRLAECKKVAERLIKILDDCASKILSAQDGHAHVGVGDRDTDEAIADALARRIRE